MLCRTWAGYEYRSAPTHRKSAQIDHGGLLLIVPFGAQYNATVRVLIQMYPRKVEDTVGDPSSLFGSSGAETVPRHGALGCSVEDPWRIELVCVAVALAICGSMPRAYEVKCLPGVPTLYLGSSRPDLFGYEGVARNL